MIGWLRRDTDRDWETLGRNTPYWAVLTHPEYAGAQNLDAEAAASFFQSGESYIAWVRETLENKLGAPRC